MIRIGVIGSGAAAERLHLPAIASLPETEATWIVDVQPQRSKMLSEQYGIQNVTDDYTRVSDVDAVIIATPHRLHVPMTELFLKRGVHVLCEKPLALRTKDADRIVELAQERSLVLAVGVFRRYYAVSSFFRSVIEKDWLGPVERIDAEEGLPWSPYVWDFHSRFMMERDRAGGGVLIDTGSHTLDRILWWFGGPEVTLESYLDNSYGGVETDCEIRFSIPWRDRQIPARVELSRTRTLRNTFQVYSSFGVIESPANVPDKAWLTDRRLSCHLDASQPIPLDLSAQPEAKGGVRQSPFERQLGDFCRAIVTDEEPLNAGATVVPVVRLIESCYAGCQRMPEPWVDLGLDRTFLIAEGQSG